jgi:hypothetical protein
LLRAKSAIRLDSLDLKHAAQRVYRPVAWSHVLGSEGREALFLLLLREQGVCDEVLGVQGCARFAFLLLRPLGASMQTWGSTKE